MGERVAVDGGWVTTVRRGRGDAVVLLPSAGRGAADFDNLAGRLSEAGFSSIAVNPRGADDASPAPDGVTLHDLAADIAVVVERTGGPAHIVGHAFGNRVARCVAADRPDLVRSVTLLAAGGLVPPKEEVTALLARCFDIDRADHLADVAAAFFAPGNDPSAWAGGWWPGAASAQAAAVSRTPREDWWEAGGEVPILVVQGCDDVVAVPENGHRLAAQLGDRVQVVDVAGAGHALLPERPAEVAAAVLAFLRAGGRHSE